MKIIAVTLKGQKKQENEDRIIIGQTVLADGLFEGELSACVLAVADGVGGNNAGAVASEFVARRLSLLQEVSREALEDINDALLVASEADPGCAGMATTLSGLCIGGDQGQLFSIGNTRVWQLQGGKYLKQLTRDDTVLNYLLETGQLTAAEAENFDRKHEITACFGGGSPLFFHLGIRDVQLPPSPILLTSDGIHDHLSVDSMELLLEELGLTADACFAIIGAAHLNGSHDDTSILLAIPEE